MKNPVSTYRIQFHKDFTFRDLEPIIPYLDTLGIRTLYASPIFDAVPGSLHGYDSVNPQRINPEIGTLDQLRRISDQLRQRGISWIQDIVPNHMAFDPHNGWLMDVLEKGQRSAYAPFFDIDWQSPVHEGRLMVPFLGAPLEEVIDRGELTVHYQNGTFGITYFDTTYPLNVRAYATILKAGPSQPGKAVQQLLDQIDRSLSATNATEYARQTEAYRQALVALMADKGDNAYVRKCLKTVNQTPACIREITDQQAYRLCFHGETDQQINYRRFFTVNALICLNIQDPAVFEAVHQLPKQLLLEGIIHGLRVDHIDGLHDPSQYLHRLRQLAGPQAYIVVEKILQNDEPLPTQWPIQGATGYAYLSMVNNLFTRKDSEAPFTRFYHKLLGEKTAVRQELHDKKAFILYEHMNGELDNLLALFRDLNLLDAHRLESLTPDLLKTAIGELLIQCPVYRYYTNQMPLREPEATALQTLFERIRQRKPELGEAVDGLEDALLVQPATESEEYRQRALRFYQRCMQFTGPLMAKGVEDTLMYTYTRFIGHDEVGDSPEYFGLRVSAYHTKMQERQAHWPLTLNATSTHDTKRGEDVRSRLNVLTDLAEEWIAQVEQWQALNGGLKTAIEGQGPAPDANDEYFIYQTLVGAYPFTEPEEAAFGERLAEYLQKAMREAKRRSSYGAPDETYEEATQRFARRLLDKSGAFWSSFAEFQGRVAEFGIVNSLAQVMLKCVSPGVPDIYQGCEGWDLSLVDPDNRRAVDYGVRMQALDAMLARADGAGIWQELWARRRDAGIKQWLVHMLLRERNRNPDLFAHGHYIPLSVEGHYKDHVIAFARRYRHSWYVVVVPLGLARLCRQQHTDVMGLNWLDTRILPPAGAPLSWQHCLTDQTGKIADGIPIADLFTELPVALLRLEKRSSERSAGILMPITSLPSPFGIGDFGPGAIAFADFLSRSQQTYWQVLPLNPVAAECAYSPYSAISSMAGNPFLLSPDWLMEEGLLTEADLPPAYLPAGSAVDYEAMYRTKKDLLGKAGETARRQGHEQEAFDQFCEQEASWLDDFALYVVLKEHHDNLPWHRWPKPYKSRQQKALSRFRNEQAEAIRQVQWLQFLFTRQWNRLKAYCNSLGIQLFGDLPFYMNYDSVDVWANPQFFSLDKEGHMIGVAGVPPDYFNANGQRWGMPVFRWDALKKTGYSWWIDRLRKNIERYDLLRLDHFRAFASYWEVPAEEETAIEGEWKAGPGADFFRTVQNALGELPFVAEDLGDIDEGVYQLRDAFGLPGMKVIQFAFGDDMPETVNSLHHHTPNSIAYTGTHDNNTSVGWYRQDTSYEHRSQLERYVGHPVLETDVHLVLARLAYASVANITILPLPDVLGLDESARLNTPASDAPNWTWRLLPEQLTSAAEERLREWVTIYDR